MIEHSQSASRCESKQIVHNFESGFFHVHFSVCAKRKRTNKMDIQRVLILPVLFVSVFILISSVVVSAQRQGECCQAYCYDLDSERPQTAHFATKTPYLIAKGPESGRQYLVPSTYPFQGICSCSYERFSI